jgi:hypothetical protein
MIKNPQIEDPKAMDLGVQPPEQLDTTPTRRSLRIQDPATRRLELQLLQKEDSTSTRNLGIQDPAARIHELQLLKPLDSREFTI